MNQKVLILVGPTASGKKRLSLEIAKKFNGEIISADSRKVYRYLDIGTAKPSLDNRREVPHYLIDIVKPDKFFSAGDWVENTTPIVYDILLRSNLPIISGGTGFYISAFMDGLTAGIEPDSNIRKKLQEKLDTDGVSALYKLLREVDSKRADELHEHDTFRILRALEIYYTTGLTFSDIRKHKRITGGDYDYLTIGIQREREELNRSIDNRVDLMMKKGLVEEVNSLLEKGFSRDIPGFDTVGYKEWFSYFDGLRSQEECLAEVKQNTRKYAKRQMTWFRARKDIHWFSLESLFSQDVIFSEIEQWLCSKYEKS